MDEELQSGTMALRRLGIKSILISISAAAAVAAVLTLLWYRGGFLPSWISWNEVSVSAKAYDKETLGIIEKSSDAKLPDSIISECTGNVTAVVHDKKINVADDLGNTIWTLDKKCLVQDALFADIDRDGADELLVLCWKIGKYGNRKPFWVDKDERKWSQHIFIYEIAIDDVHPKWMASNIGKNVASWRAEDNGYIVDTAPDGEESTWRWVSWGLERVTSSAPASTAPMPPSSLSAQSAPAASSAPESTVEIIMVGDMLLHDGVDKSCELDDGGYDFAPLFAHTGDKIRSADLAIVNEEVILGGEELRVSGYPSFNGPFEVADALSDAGFDVVCHATNHALDRGKKGILSCRENWRSTHPKMAVIGIYDGADGNLDETEPAQTQGEKTSGSQPGSEQVYITRIKDIDIAILNYTYGTNGIALPSDMPNAVNMLNKDKISKDLDYACAHADFVVVCPHWGIEYQLTPSKEQIDMAEFMTENGADLIIGTHPHVVQPVEYVESKNGNKALCYYSLGNYINWTSGRGNNVSNRMLGFMADVTVVKDETGDVSITEYEAIPLVSHVESTKGGVTTYFLEDYTEAMAQQNEIRKQDANFSREYLEDLFIQIKNASRESDTAPRR